PCERVPAVGQPFCSRVSAVERHGTPSVDHEATYRASERAVTRRRTRPGPGCSYLWLFRPKPFHSDLRSIRRPQSGKVASAPTQLGGASGSAPNGARDYAPFRAVVLCKAG